MVNVSWFGVSERMKPVVAPLQRSLTALGVRARTLSNILSSQVGSASSVSRMPDIIARPVIPVGVTSATILCGVFFLMDSQYIIFLLVVKIDNEEFCSK